MTTRVLHFVKTAMAEVDAMTEGETLVVMAQTVGSFLGEVTIRNQQGQRVDSFQTSSLVRHLLLAEDESLLLFLDGDHLYAHDLDAMGRTRSPMLNQAYHLRLEGDVSAIALSSDKSLLAVGMDRTVQLYQIREGKPPRPIQALEVSGCGTLSIRFVGGGNVLRVVSKDSVEYFRDDE